MNNSKRGSVLIVALGLALLLVVSAAAYIYLAVGTYQRSSRSFRYNSAMNVAEAGAEEAMWALNNNDWTKRGWTDSGSDKVLLYDASKPDFTDSSGAKGYFNVRVKNYSSTTPTIAAEAVISTGNSQSIRKQIRIETKLVNILIPPFASLNKLKLNGGDFASYLESEGKTPDAATRRDNTTIGSLDVDIPDTAIKASANIYGHLEVGVSSDKSAAFLKTVLGSITSDSTVSGGSGVVQNGSNLIDTNQIAYDFTQDYPDPGYPDETKAGTTIVYSLPPVNNQGRYVLGTAGSTDTTIYKIESGNVSGSFVAISPVVIEVTSTVSGEGGFSVGSTDSVTVMDTTNTTTEKISGHNQTYTYVGEANASLEIYATGTISISGNGSVLPSSSDPSDLKVYAMGTYGQKVSIGGNGNLLGIIYAPKADLTFNGGGSSGYFAGASVGYNVTVNGTGYDILYPEELANVPIGSTYTPSKWVELTNPSDWQSF